MKDRSNYKKLFDKNPHIYSSPEETEFYCETCKKDYGSISSISKHCKDAHNVDRFGNIKDPNNPIGQEKPSPKSGQVEPSQATSESPAEPELDLTENVNDTPLEKDLKKRLRELKNPTEPSDEIVTAVQNAAYMESVKDLTTKAAAIVTNYKLMFTYFEAKRLRMIPPHWDFERTIFESFASFLKSIGFSIESRINRDSLPEAVLQFHLAVEQDWKKWDEENSKQVVEAT